ncbi:FemAB family PEP-CTERM system-associated protein [candidate division KSB1 bacterium]|nr:FemAB family PEP-CTERM system-associated protein [candidate division KSB1 bacterium]NIS25321.1 FemAB family PEP-CTERM system-associated protein [candidate division KSB1 bacterium]NIU26040.1 FemAB family PEP-CTERM system-associated protein [candidate division KSB1 bacterium]NIU89187.1 FemAB family PEP-CTERM system-associated protein [candidate division KSB1 bacterium]NIV91244.1 FemAB family PEP-CTERM system-associated protein [candidate division KSB1 bacterium]
MKVVPLTKDREHVWDGFVSRHPRANMYHLMGWKTVFESVFGYSSYYLMAENSEGQVTGMLPMFLMTDIFRRRYLISNPFSNFAGICSDNQEAEDELLQAAQNLAHELNVRYVEFRQMKHKLNGGLSTKESFVTLMLELPQNAEVSWKAISSRNRNKIRKAEKNGLQTDFGMQHLQSFYKLYAKNMKFLGTPVFPYAMFEQVAQVFDKQTELLVLKLNGEPVAGMFMFKFKDTISEPWVASLRAYNKIYVNNLLYWQAISYACSRGFKRFDFGRSTKDSGTHRFKQQWGAEPIQLHYQYYLNQAREIPAVDANNNKYQKIVDVWKRLPLTVTNFVGPKVVQFLPEL